MHKTINVGAFLSVLLRLWGDLRKPPLIAFPQLLYFLHKLEVVFAQTSDPVVLPEHSDMTCRISSAAWSFPIRVFRTVSIALHTHRTELNAKSMLVAGLRNPKAGYLFLLLPVVAT